MIDVTHIESALELTSGDPEAVKVRDTIISIWEQETGALWDERLGHVEVVRLPFAGSSIVGLQLRPVASVTLVEVSDDGQEWTELEADEWYLTPGGHHLRRLPVAWPSLVRVTYDGGWADGAEPAAVRDALTTQMLFASSRNHTDRVALASVSKGDATTSYLAPGLHPDLRRTISKYRRRT